MTTYARGDIVEAGDPFTETKPLRPFLIINTDAHPFHGEQYVAVSVTTKTWYDETISLDASDFREGGVPEESSIVPWGIASPSHDDITDWFGRIASEVVDKTVERTMGYLTE